ncbi:MAG: hypothetical protein Kow0092_19690 [Deferrisomatales bacterium]
MLPRSYPRAMAEKAAALMLDSGALRCSDPAVVVHIVERALTEELQVEAQIREEAARLLATHRREARAHGADVDVLLEKIVSKLARERGAVLR